MHPLRRFASVFEARDFPRLAVGLLGVAKRALLGHPQRAVRPTLSDRCPALLADVMAGARFIADRWFRFQARGLENVPMNGPSLLVGNHSGGIVNFDTILTFLAIWEHFGPDRALYGLGHELTEWDPTIQRYTSRFGVLTASHESARIAFDAGHLALVYPGSDYDAFPQSSTPSGIREAIRAQLRRHLHQIDARRSAATPPLDLACFLALAPASLPSVHGRGGGLRLPAVQRAQPCGAGRAKRIHQAGAPCPGAHRPGRDGGRA